MDPNCFRYNLEESFTVVSVRRESFATPFILHYLATFDTGITPFPGSISITYNYLHLTFHRIGIKLKTQSFKTMEQLYVQNKHFAWLVLCICVKGRKREKYNVCSILQLWIVREMCL